MNEKKAPEIRFEGFTDDWEQRKFSDITYPSGEKNRDNLPYESYSITNESGFVPQDEKFENGGTMRDADKRMYYIVSPQSFAYNPARINVGSIGYQNTSKNVIVSSLYEIFKTTEEVDDRFLWHWFKSDDFQKLIVQLQEGGVRLYFYYDKLCMGSIALPSLAEQQRIGAYLDKLDNLITLHQRKHKKLLSVKKSMLEKMFPQNGAKVPEIRFEGFTDDWEQRKVSEITSVAPFKPYLSDVEYGGEYEVIQQGDKPILGYANGKPFMEYEKTTLFGDHTLSLYKTKSPFFVASDGLKILYSEEMDGYFYYYLLEKYKPESEGYKRHFSILKECECSFPKSGNEQKKIGQYFNNLDHLITLHQRELDKLVNIKKSMLEKMFV